MKNKNTHALIGIFIFWVASILAFSQTDSQPAPRGTATHGQPPNVADAAKNVVVGELKTLETTKLTVARPDGVEQSVAVDANTKFVGDRGDTITLADFKPGDKVAAIGALKDGTFVAAQLAKLPSAPAAPPPLPPFPSPPNQSN